MNEILQAIDTASNKSDRWLFIAAIVVLVLGCIAVSRYFVKQHEGLLKDAQGQRELYQNELTKLVAQYAQTTGELKGCLDRNSQALEAHAEVIASCKLKSQI